MPLLYISLAVKRYEEKVSKVIWVVSHLSYRRRGVRVYDFMLSKDRSLQSHLQSKFATNGPVIMHVMILLCATSSKGAVLVCSDST